MENWCRRRVARRERARVQDLFVPGQALVWGVWRKGCGALGNAVYVRSVQAARALGQTSMPGPALA
jgi:hypothetical protein